MKTTFHHTSLPIRYRLGRRTSWLQRAYTVAVLASLMLAYGWAGFEDEREQERIAQQVKDMATDMQTVRQAHLER